MQPFYSVAGVPVQSVRLLASRAEARRFPTGEIVLGFCPCCGFVANLAFEPARVRYGAGYESTQAYSATFRRFQEGLVERLVRDYELRGKVVVEIGCGHGEFLALLCAAGAGRGIGFDPAHDAEKAAAGADGRIAFVRELYSDRHRGHGADVLCCKMTLEHVADAGAFVDQVRRTVDPGTLVFFQVPSAERILSEAAFWDVYYEHCSYFTADALAWLFESRGFRAVEEWTDYGGQYLMLIARAGERDARRPDPAGGRWLEAVATFASRCAQRVERWRRELQGDGGAGRPLAIWGAGSKAVAFLHALGLGDEVACLVDVNPRKHDTYLAGGGQPILSPERLRDLDPATVVVMNPVYRGEIEAELDRLGLRPRLVVLDA
jgi:SAM-dependent methyltransferase